MNKLTSFTIVAVMFFAVANIYAAEPFTAPATFDFSGSTVYLEATVELPFVGEVDVDIDPNPVPVTGELVVETLNEAGNWIGYGEGSGETTANAPVVGAIPVFGEAGGSAEGVFDFANDRVTVYSDDAWAKINVAGTDYIFDIDEGEGEAQFDGTYITYEISGNEEMDILGFTFRFYYEIKAAGELKETSPEESLDAFIDTNQGDYTSGEAFDCSIGVERRGPDITVDVWIVLLNPAGQILFFPTFTTTLGNVPGVTIPANFSARDIPIFHQTLPGTYPPIQDSGAYIIAIGLSSPGTTDFYSIASKAFNFVR